MPSPTSELHGCMSWIPVNLLPLLSSSWSQEKAVCKWLNSRFMVVICAL